MGGPARFPNFSDADARAAGLFWCPRCGWYDSQVVSGAEMDAILQQQEVFAKSPYPPLCTFCWYALLNVAQTCSYDALRAVGRAYSEQIAQNQQARAVREAFASPDEPTEDRRPAQAAPAVLLQRQSPWRRALALLLSIYIAITRTLRISRRTS